MLDRIDLIKVFDTLQQRGYVWSEIYSERRHHVSMRVREKIEDLRQAHVHGMSIRCFNGQRFDWFDSNSGDLERLLGFAPSTQTTNETSRAASEQSLERASRIAQNARQIQLTLPGIEGMHCEYEEVSRYFEVARSGSEPRSGVERSATFDARWVVPCERPGAPARLSDASSDPQRLVDLWTGENGLLKAARQSMESRAQWPAPDAKLPILWSPKAVARLVYLFTRGFEGDLVLRDFSFLNSTTLPLPLRFNLEDRGKDPNAIDHEGTPRRSMRFLHEGKPRALAVDSKRAEQFDVPRTGHGRRQGFEYPPTIAYWNLSFAEDTPRRAFKSSIDRGIYVGDFAVTEFDLATSRLTLRLDDGRLIHQGEIGEAIGRTFWTTSLVDLMASWIAFESDDQSNGFALNKDGQRLVVEVEAPSALSEPLHFPGSVPASNYW